MPKETVQYPRTDGRDGTEISIHWGKRSGHVQSEEHVQISGVRHYWHQIESVERTVASPYESLPMIGTEAKVDERFMSDPLTRSEVNKLIATLRRARKHSATTNKSSGDLSPDKYLLRYMS